MGATPSIGMPAGPLMEGIVRMLREDAIRAILKKHGLEENALLLDDLVVDAVEEFKKHRDSVERIRAEHAQQK